MARRFPPLPSWHLVHHRQVVPEQGGGRRPAQEGPQLRIRRKVRGVSVAEGMDEEGVLTVFAGEESLTNDANREGARTVTNLVPLKF